MKTAIIYEQPECLITEIEAQSVLCQSGVESNVNLIFNDPFNEEQNW